MSNKTALLFKAQDMRMVQCEVPEPGEGEILLKINSVGICGSDVHYWWKGRTGRFVVESPIVLGHESSGTVVKTGPQVTSLVPGDRVAIEPGIPCRKCDLCKIGKYNVCPDVKFCATPPVNGTLTEYYVHPADFCFKLPDHVSNEEGAMVEPLSVALYSCRRAEIAVGSRVLILGAGPIGIISLLTAKAMGCFSVCITDINESRLQFARSQGADYTCNVLGKTTEAVAAEIKSQMSPTAIIECSGAETSYKLALMVGSPGSIMVTVGRGNYDVELPLSLVTIKEMEIRGIFRYSNCYQDALDMIAKKQLDVFPLITHRFQFKDVLDAFSAAREGLAIKVMINLSQ